MSPPPKSTVTSRRLTGKKKSEGSELPAADSTTKPEEEGSASPSSAGRFVVLRRLLIETLSYPIHAPLLAWLFDTLKPNVATDGIVGSEEAFTFADVVTVWKRIIVLAIPDWHLVLTSLFIALVTAACDLLLPISVGYAINAATGSGTGSASEDTSINETALRNSLVVMVILQVIKGLTEYSREGTNNNIGDFIRQRAQKLLFQNLLKQDRSFFDETHTSDVNKRYNDLDRLHYFAGRQIPMVVTCTLTMLCTSAYMLHEDASIGMVVVSLIFLQVVIEKAMDKTCFALHLKLKSVEKKANRCREESIANIRTVKHFSCEQRQSDAFGHELDKDMEIRSAMVSVWAKRCGVGNFLLGLVVCAVWILGLPRVRTGSVTLGELSSFSLLVSHVREAATKLLHAYHETIKRAPDLQKSFELMDRRPTMVHIPPSSEMNQPPFQRQVQLRDVHFSYPTRPDHKCCSGINLTLRPGTCTALCGPSGGGKSTIVSLILRDYDPCRGAVLVDGKDMREMDLHSLHEQIAIVSQEPALFSATIKENIKFGSDHDVSDEDVYEASRMANVHDFVCNFERGYDTEVGERGVQLSGGQKQRIAIARAILKNPAILILDEATSALDAESEFVVQSALDRVMVGRTTLVIAHRLSTIKNADNIVVIQDGCVVEEGNCEHLLALDGAYAALVKRQLSTQAQHA